MTKSFIQSLIGMQLQEASLIVQREGYLAYPVQGGMAITAEAKPDTIILYHDGEKVTYAHAGDPLQVEAD